MSATASLVSRSIIYEAIGMVVIYFVSKWWFGQPSYETIEYTIVVFIALSLYYIFFHFVHQKINEEASSQHLKL